MGRSIFIARLVGPIMIAAGAGMLFNATLFHAIFEQALKDHATIYLSGFVSMAIGLTIVNLHNEWEWNWPVVLTVFGWLAVIGGIVRIVAPQLIEMIGLCLISHANFFSVAGGVAFLLGVLLSYFGYLKPPDLMPSSAPASRSRKRSRR
jgi:hypothetical protein